MAVGAAGGAIAGILIGNNLRRLARGIAAASEAWRPLEAKGLALGTETVGGLKIAAGKERPVLTGVVTGVECSVRIVSDFVHYAHTRICAKTPAPTQVRVGVHPSPGGLLGSIRSWLGQDIEIGDEAFDEAFLITAEPTEVARALLVPSVREKVVALASGRLAGFTFGEGEATVLLHDVETDPITLEVALDLVIEASHFTG